MSKDDLYTKLSSKIYNTLYLLHSHNSCASPYIQNVKNILDSIGFSGCWLSQDTINDTWFKAAATQRINDQHLQDWSATLNTTSSGMNYKLFKDSPQ